MEDPEALDAFLTKDPEALQRMIEETELSKGGKAFLRALAERVGQAYQAQAVRLEREMRQQAAPAWHIVTELAPQGSVLRRGMTSVLETAAQGTSFFYDGSYEAFDAFCQKSVPAPYTGEHVGKVFSYRLEPDERYAEAERTLFDLAEQEHRTAPVLFSPWARRAVRVQVVGAEETPSLTLDDLRLADNGLTRADGSSLLLGGTLCWNVQMEQVQPKTANQVDRAGGTGSWIYTYPHTVTNGVQERLLSHAGARHIETSMVEGAVKTPEFVVRTSDELDPVTWQATLVTITEVEDRAEDAATATLFSAKLSEDPPQRLLTAGDVARLLHALATPFGRAELLTPSAARAYGAADEIPSYALLTYLKNPSLAHYGVHRACTELALAFSADDASFLTDYANYVRHYLARCYPEFRWRCYKKKAGV